MEEKKKSASNTRKKRQIKVIVNGELNLDKAVEGLYMAMKYSKA